jgi:hypothetical protein
MCVLQGKGDENCLSCSLWSVSVTAVRGLCLRLGLLLRLRLCLCG